MRRIGTRRIILLVALAAALAGPAAADDADRYAHVRQDPPQEAAPEPEEAAPRKADPPTTGAASIGDEALRALVRRHAADQGVPFDLAHAVVIIESRYNPSARNGPHYGLTQIMHATARSMGFSGAPAALLDPETNLRFGMRYLGEAYRLAGGDVCGAVLRYQAGHRAVRMTQAARRYCERAKVLGAAAK